MTKADYDDNLLIVGVKSHSLISSLSASPVKGAIQHRKGVHLLLEKKRV